MERLDLDRRLFHPLEVTEVVLGEPWFELKRFLSRLREQRSSRRNRVDPHEARPADDAASLAVTLPVLLSRVLRVSEGNIDREEVELRSVVENLGELPQDEGLL